MEDILAAVRCQFLPPKFLNDQIQKCDVIKKTPACKEYLAKIFKVVYSQLISLLCKYATKFLTGFDFTRTDCRKRTNSKHP